jgi:hypothetical protein
MRLLCRYPDKGWSTATVPDVFLHKHARELYTCADLLAHLLLHVPAAAVSGPPSSLLQVLQYHVVPAAAVRSTQLKDGQQLTTALEGASPLTVKINKGKVTINDNDQDAEVITADVGAGKAVIHVIDEVMIPSALVRKTGSASKPASKP